MKNIQKILSLAFCLVLFATVQFMFTEETYATERSCVVNSEGVSSSQNCDESFFDNEIPAIQNFARTLIAQADPESPCLELTTPDRVEECLAQENEEPPATETGTGSNTTGNSELDSWLQKAVDLLSGLVGFVFVISFIFAGYQYMTARDNASQVGAAKERILTLVVTFLLFVFGYGLLQWLIPGGIFK